MYDPLGVFGFGSLDPQQRRQMLPNMLGTMGASMLANASMKPGQAMGNAFLTAQNSGQNDLYQNQIISNMQANAEDRRSRLKMDEETRKRRLGWAQLPENKNNPMAQAYLGGLIPDDSFGDAMVQSLKPGQLTPEQELTQQIEARKKAAADIGLTPDSPAYQGYTLTGRLPREDQAPLTAKDKQAILEADEVVMTSDSADKLLDKALELSKTAYEGASANERGWFMSQFGNQAANDTRELNQVVTQEALTSLKAIFGGNPTEGERKILLDIQGSAEMPQKVRESIYARAKEAVARRRAFYKQRADELRQQEYYKPGGGGSAPQDAGGEWTDLGNGYKIRLKSP